MTWRGHVLFSNLVKEMGFFRNIAFIGVEESQIFHGGGSFFREDDGHVEFS